MNRQEIEAKVNSQIYLQCKSRGYTTPVDVLMGIGVLSKENHLKWCNGKVPYLEMVCNGSLNSLSFIMKCMRSYAAKNDLKPSITFYKQYGSKPVKKLRFSKSNNPQIEQAYATHYVMKKVKEEKNTSEN